MWLGFTCVFYIFNIISVMYSMFYTRWYMILCRIEKISWHEEQRMRTTRAPRGGRRGNDWIVGARGDTRSGEKNRGREKYRREWEVYTATWVVVRLTEWGRGQTILRSGRFLYWRVGNDSFETLLLCITVFNLIVPFKIYFYLSQMYCNLVL